MCGSAPSAGTIRRMMDGRMYEPKTPRDPFTSARPPRRAAAALRTAAIVSIVMGLLLLLLGARFMSDAAGDVSHMLGEAVPAGGRWIMLIGVAVLIGGFAALYPAFRKRGD
jgi:hypothetical protein